MFKMIVQLLGGSVDAAPSVFRRMEEAVPSVDPVFAFFEHAAALEEAGAWQDLVDLGLPVLEKVASEADGARVRCFLACAYLSLEQYVKALEIADAALNLVLHNPAAYDLQARSLALCSAACRNLGYSDYARDNLNDAIALVEKKDPSVITNITRIRVYINAGAFAQDIEQSYVKAAEYYTKALILMPLASRDSEAVRIRLQDCFKNMPTPIIFGQGLVTGAELTATPTITIQRRNSAQF